jgi:hypothetical protein
MKGETTIIEETIQCPRCSATGKRGWRHEDEHPLDSKPFLAVLRGPRCMRYQAVLQWDEDGYLVQPSPNGPEMIGKHMVIEAWRPLPVYRPNAKSEVSE